MRPATAFAIRGFALSLGLSLCTAAAAAERVSTPETAKPSADAEPVPAGRKLGKPYQVAGVWYAPAEQRDYDETGGASYYGDQFHGRRTASGEAYDKALATAAHPTLPLQSMLEVTEIDSGRSVKVRVNDRGPFHGGRIIDLSRAAAEQLGLIRKGTARVRVRYLGHASEESGKAPAPEPPVAEPAPVLRLAKAEGRKPTAKPLPPAERTEPAPAETSSEHAFAIQAGAFADRGNAERAAGKLRFAGKTEIRPLERESGRLYRVLVGGWSDQDAAASALDGVAAAGFADARVVKAF